MNLHGGKAERDDPQIQDHDPLHLGVLGKPPDDIRRGKEVDHRHGQQKTAREPHGEPAALIDAVEPAGAVILRDHRHQGNAEGHREDERHDFQPRSSRRGCDRRIPERSDDPGDDRRTDRHQQHTERGRNCEPDYGLPGFPERVARNARRSDEPVPGIQQTKCDNAAHRLRNHCCQRRAGDSHDRETAPAENKQRVEQYIQTESEQHEHAGRERVPGRDQQIVAGHAERAGEAAEIPDQHILNDIGHDVRAGAAEAEGRFDRKSARRADRQRSEHHQHEPGSDQPGRFGAAAAAERVGRRRHDSDAKPSVNAADQHDDREGESHCGELVGAERGDEPGIGDVVAGNRQRSRQHRTGGAEHGRSDRPVDVGGCEAVSHKPGEI